MKISRMIANARSQRNTSETLQKYIDELDWSRVWREQHIFYGFEGGEPVPEYFYGVCELALAILAHPNVNRATVKKIWEKATFPGDTWPIEYLCEFVKQITDDELIAQIYSDMRKNSYRLYEESWKALRAVLQDKPSAYSEHFKSLKFY